MYDDVYDLVDVLDAEESARVRTLMTEAGAAGDLAQVYVCRAALAGGVWALHRVRATLAQAHAQTTEHDA